MDERARRRAAMPAGRERFLDVRSLVGDNRVLADLLRPGLRVLDVGCGSGAITRGIAAAVGPHGEVVGIDLSPDLIRRARAAAAAADVANARFELADVARFDAGAGFDVVAAARVLQWLADPLAALDAMTRATRPGGRVLVLDYDHTAAEWQPPLPDAAARWYRAFLTWRAEAGMDNAIARSLPQLFERAGLTAVERFDAPETTRSGEPDFPARIELWPGVIATRGHQLVADGLLSEAERAEAESSFRAWAREPHRRQTLRLAAVVGTRAG